MKPSPGLQYFTPSQWRGIKFLLVLMWLTALYRVVNVWLLSPRPADFQEFDQRFEQRLKEIRSSTEVVPAVSADSPQQRDFQEKSDAANTIDLNTASIKTLITLPRIGPGIAQRIIDYRTRHGPFKTVRDLVKVRGIGPKTLERLRPLVTVSAPP